jgi:hypothetical protein
MRSGGERGIRTPDTREGMPAFEAGAINHSAISPRPLGTSRQWYFIRLTDAGGSLNRFFSFFRQTKNAICDLIDHLDHFRAKRARVGVEGHARVAVPELRLHFRRMRLFGAMGGEATAEHLKGGVKRDAQFLRIG